MVNKNHPQETWLALSCQSFLPCRGHVVETREAKTFCNETNQYQGATWKPMSGPRGTTLFIHENYHMSAHGWTTSATQSETIPATCTCCCLPCVFITTIVFHVSPYGRATWHLSEHAMSVVRTCHVSPF
jgi:hypothetical protein